MDKERFYALIQENDKYFETTAVEDLQSSLGCVVRIRRTQRSGHNKYLMGGIITHVDPDTGWINFKSMINHKTYRMRVANATFYICSKPVSELQAWTDFANQTFGPDTIKITQLP